MEKIEAASEMRIDSSDGFCITLPYIVEKIAESSEMFIVEPVEKSDAQEFYPATRFNIDDGERFLFSFGFSF